jgi:hypothetical protein
MNGVKKCKWVAGYTLLDRLRDFLPFDRICTHFSALHCEYAVADLVPGASLEVPGDQIPLRPKFAELFGEQSIFVVGPLFIVKTGIDVVVPMFATLSRVRPGIAVATSDQSAVPCERIAAMRRMSSCCSNFALGVYVRSIGIKLVILECFTKLNAH